MEKFEYIKNNLEKIKKNMEEAKKSSPYGQETGLLIAGKYASAEELNYAASLGYTCVGENRVQQLLYKYDKLDKSIELHFIGTLQKNKVKYIIDKVKLIHSLDSPSLAEEIERRASEKNLKMGVLIEINIGGEDTKGGIAPSEALAFADMINSFPHLELRGVMTMGPKSEDEAQLRKYFKETYDIFIDIYAKKIHNKNRFAPRPVLSMGMSTSYIPAIKEGATLIRVGSAIFNK